MVAFEADISVALHNVWDNLTYDFLNSRDDAMGDIPKKDRSGGAQLEHVQRAARTSSMRFQTEATNLMEPGQQGYYKGFVSPVEWWWTIGVSVRANVLSGSVEGAYINAFQGELEFGVKDYRVFMEKYLWGDGTGVQGYWKSGAGGLANYYLQSTGSPTRTIFMLGDFSGTDLISKNGFYQARHMFPGQRLQGVINDLTPAGVPASGSATATDETVLVVDSIDLLGGLPIIYLYDEATNAAITAASEIGARTAVDNSTIYFIDAGVRGTDGAIKRHCQMGLQGIVSNTDPPMDPNGLQQIPAADQLTWRAQVLGNNGQLRPMNEWVLSQAVDASEVATGGGISRFAAAYGTVSQYAIDQLNTHREVNTMSIRGGYREDTAADDLPMYGKFKLYKSRFLHPEKVLGLDWGKINLVFWKRPGFWAPGGPSDVVHRAYGGQTQMRAEQYGFWELACEQRNSHVLINDVDGSDTKVL